MTATPAGQPGVEPPDKRRSVATTGPSAWARPGAAGSPACPLIGPVRGSTAAWVKAASGGPG